MQFSPIHKNRECQVHQHMSKEDSMPAHDYRAYVPSWRQRSLLSLNFAGVLLVLVGLAALVVVIKYVYWSVVPIDNYVDLHEFYFEDGCVGKDLVWYLDRTIDRTMNAEVSTETLKKYRDGWMSLWLRDHRILAEESSDRVWLTRDALPDTGMYKKYMKTTYFFPFGIKKETTIESNTFELEECFEVDVVY